MKTSAQAVVAKRIGTKGNYKKERAIRKASKKSAEGDGDSDDDDEAKVKAAEAAAEAAAMLATSSPGKNETQGGESAGGEAAVAAAEGSEAAASSSAGAPSEAAANKEQESRPKESTGKKLSIAEQFKKNKGQYIIELKYPWMHPTVSLLPHFSSSTLASTLEICIK